MKEDGVQQMMLGNAAIARGAYEAGVKVSAAYPGTPSTEISENIAAYKDVIYSEWSPNEKVATEVAIGASISGVRALVSMKHVGVNVAADPLYTISYCGVNGGLVLVAADDPGIYSSQNEQDSRMVARAAMVPALEPSDSQEAKDFTKLAFAFSEKYDTPVMVRTTTRLAHSQGLVSLGEREEAADKPYVKDIRKTVMMPMNAIKRHLAVEKRLHMMAEDANTMEINRIEYRDKNIGVITGGIPYQYVREALPEASVLKLGLVHPLPRKLIEEFAASVKTLYVVEELEPVMEEQIKSWGIKAQGKEIGNSLVDDTKLDWKGNLYRSGRVQRKPSSGKGSRDKTGIFPCRRGSGKTADPLSRMSAQKRIFRAEEIKTSCGRGYRLLYFRRCSSAFGGGYDDLHGSKHFQPSRYGKGKGTRIYQGLGCRYRRFYLFTYRC